MAAGPCIGIVLIDLRCRILSRLRAAAGPDTKLLIGDMLLPYACHDDASPESSFAPKDSPLLPNLGKGNIHGYLIDIMVSDLLRIGDCARKKADIACV